MDDNWGDLLPVSGPNHDASPPWFGSARSGLGEGGGGAEGAALKEVRHTRPPSPKRGEEIEAVPLFVVVSERKLIYMIILTSAAARYSGAPSDQTYLPEFDLIDSVAAAA
jgi:hypothetical protein